MGSTRKIIFLIYFYFFASHRSSAGSMRKIIFFYYFFFGITQEQCRVYAQNLSLRDEIEKDTKRTWPDMHFFREEEDFEGAEDEHYDGGTGLPGRHQMAITRVLYTFARVNPGIR